MNKQTEALKMAIEALESITLLCDDKRWYLIGNARKACKEALEQPVVMERDYNFMRDLAIGTEDILNEMLSAKPVAWIKKTWCPELDWYDDFKSGAFADETDKEGWTPLYTHFAPSWQGLSDDEIAKIYESMSSKPRIDGYEWDYARAIEQALKEKNNAM